MSFFSANKAFSLLVFMMIFFLLIPLSIAQTDKEAVPLEEERGYLGKELLLEAKTDLYEEDAGLKLPSVGEVAFRMIFFLFIVLFLMFGVFLLLQRFLVKAPVDKNLNQDVIRILCHRKFDTKKGVYLVDVLGKILVIGSDFERLNLITEITDPEKIAQARKMADVTPEIYRLNPFQGVIEKFSGEYQDETVRTQKRESRASGLINKIEKLKSRLVR